MLKLFFILFSSLYLNAYELPIVDISTDKKPEIVVFKADSILVEEKLSYTLTWKTIYATDVNITFFGKVNTSGSITITEDEYTRGAITLTASSKKSDHVDKRELNNYKKGKAMPVFQDDTPVDDGYYGNTLPRQRMYQRALRRRVY